MRLNPEAGTSNVGVASPRRGTLPNDRAGDALAKFLTRDRLVSDADIQTAIEQASRTAMPLVDAIIASGLLSEREAYRALADCGGVPFIDLAGIAPNPLALKLVPEGVARRHRVLPLFEDNRTLTYASCVGVHGEIERDIAFASGRKPHCMIATRSQLDAALSAAFSETSSVEAVIDRIPHAGVVDIPDDLGPGVSGGQAPVIDLCNRILAAAVEAGASDVHIEPGASGAVVRHRVCGILESLLTLPPAAVGCVTNRFKILAGIDITSRQPQKGTFRISIGDRPLDIRLSALPTTHGEKIVMRVIDCSASFQSFEALGFDVASSASIRAALSKPDGLVLMTGPTGCGKTTALYAALHFLHAGRVNIVTVEDPVERYLEGVTQIPVNSGDGGFAGVLRSVMRQDPKVIMVGEIRDAEVAEIVSQAATTGHLVLSSLQTTDAASAITRLLNLGLAPVKVAESLNAVVSQRLMRKLCPFCRVSQDAFAARQMGAPLGLPAVHATVGPGCDRCQRTGYLGRVAVPEVLVPDDALRGAIRDAAAATEIRAAMRASGCSSMRQSAVVLVGQGVTSIEEVDRVLAHNDDSIAAPGQPREKPRVLITDDDRMIRMLVRMLLEREGYEVLEAENGARAIELARRERPDLMLCDLMMPDMDGFETITRLRRDVALAALPVMVLTSEAGQSVERRVLELGADDYLVKPFEAEVLIVRVKAMLRRNRTVAAA